MSWRRMMKTLVFCGIALVVVSGERGRIVGTSLQHHRHHLLDDATLLQHRPGFPPRGGGVSNLGTGGTRRAPPTIPPPQYGQSQQQTMNDAKRQQEYSDNARDVLNSFLTRDSRNTFIARVYAILAVQLFVTAGSVVAFGLHPTLGYNLWKRFGWIVPILPLCLSSIAWITMCESVKARRASPLKWQLLSLFTLGEAVSVGLVSSFYNFASVVSAMVATAVATVAVSLYTVNQKNPKYDLSQWGATLSSFGIMFLVYGLVILLMQFGILPANLLPYSDMLYALLGATLFSFYLAYHTKLIVAGKHAKYQMNEKDYVFGAMTLYNDIINIFIYILRLLGDDDRSDRRRSPRR